MTKTWTVYKSIVLFEICMFALPSGKVLMYIYYKFEKKIQSRVKITSKKYNRMYI